jgi:hypothetical protein
MNVKRRHPPLSCRTSPPQGGILACAHAFAIALKETHNLSTCNLPPRGGDARQGRGGRDESETFELHPQRCEETLCQFAAKPSTRNLPPRRGDARQGRGGREGALKSAFLTAGVS